MTWRISDVCFWIGIFLLGVTGLLMMAGCSKDRPPPVLNPGSRAIFYTNGQQTYSLCDRGNLIYVNDKNFTVIPAGCPDGQP